MKKRYFRKPVEKILAYWCLLDFMVLCSINDFEPSFLLIYLSISASLIYKMYLLSIYGRSFETK